MLVSSTLKRHNIILSQRRAGEVERRGEMRKFPWLSAPRSLPFKWQRPPQRPGGGPPPPPPIIIPPAAQLRQQPAGSKLNQSSLLTGPGKLGVPFAQSVGQRPIQQYPALQQSLAARRKQEQQAIARQAGVG